MMKESCFERVFTVACPAGQGPLAVPVKPRLPGGEASFEIECWSGRNGGANVFVFEGELSAAACAELLGGTTVDAVTTVPASGTSKRLYPNDAETVTVYFDSNNAAVTQTVTIRIRELIL